MRDSLAIIDTCETTKSSRKSPRPQSAQQLAITPVASGLFPIKKKAQWD